MKKLLFLIIISWCSVTFAQVNVSRDELPNTSSTDSTAVLNNMLRQQQNAINAVGGYFNANGNLGPGNGGTGTNISAFPNGALLIYDAGNVRVGTFGQGSSGQTVISNGPGLAPTWGNGHGFEVFKNSGTFTASAGINTVYLTMVGAGAGGCQSHSAGVTGGGGGGAGAFTINYPYTVIPSNSYTVTIGSGGASDVNGGDTSFDAITIPGGLAGLEPTGGIGSGGFDGSSLPTFKGGDGESVVSGAGGSGGATFAGGGAAGATYTGCNGNTGSAAANNTGAGGGGGECNGGLGGNGGSGLVIVSY